MDSQVNLQASAPAYTSSHKTSYTIAPELADFTLSPAQHRLSTRFARYPADRKFAFCNGSVVFHGDRVLLVQRAPTDSMPLLWETPGGACDDTDLSIVDSAVRELWEEAGLNATAVTRLLREWSWEHRRLGTLVKYVFEVEVEVEGAPVVKLDPLEHCAFVWATEQEVRDGRCGHVMLKFTSEEVRGSVLDGFAQRHRP